VDVQGDAARRRFRRKQAQIDGGVRREERPVVTISVDIRPRGVDADGTEMLVKSSFATDAGLEAMLAIGFDRAWQPRSAKPTRPSDVGPALILFS
jgi:hypothetical protein